VRTTGSDRPSTYAARWPNSAMALGVANISAPGRSLLAYPSANNHKPDHHRVPIPNLPSARKRRVGGVLGD